MKMNKIEQKAFFICMILIALVVTLDLITTIIGLEYLGAKEINTSFVDLYGYYGLFTYILFLSIIVFAFGVFFYVGKVIFKGLYFSVAQKDIESEQVVLLWFMISSFYVVSQIVNITSNIIVIFELIG